MGFTSLGNVNLNQLHRFVLNGDTLDIFSPDYTEASAAVLSDEVNGDDEV